MDYAKYQRAAGLDKQLKEIERLLEALSTVDSVSISRRSFFNSHCLEDEVRYQPKNFPGLQIVLDDKDYVELRAAVTAKMVANQAELEAEFKLL